MKQWERKRQRKTNRSVGNGDVRDAAGADLEKLKLTSWGKSYWCNEQTHKYHHGKVCIKRAGLQWIHYQGVWLHVLLWCLRNPVANPIQLKDSWTNVILFLKPERSNHNHNETPSHTLLILFGTQGCIELGNQFQLVHKESLSRNRKWGIKHLFGRESALRS